MTPQHTYYKTSKNKIKTINEHKEKYVIIWYARGIIQNIYRIISIVVKDLGTGQIREFSISLEKDSLKDFSETIIDYNKCEKNMLKTFYNFVKGQYSNKIWLHWRMKLANYSFAALENRYKSLGGRPSVIPNNNTLDVCELFKQRYGENFVDKSKKNDKSSWRIQYLAEKNSIETARYLEYDEEMKALEEYKYDMISTSLSRKTSIIEQFLDLSFKDKLKTDSKWKEIYGFSIQGAYNACKEKWWFNMIVFILGLVLGAIISKRIESLI